MVDDSELRARFGRGDIRDRIKLNKRTQSKLERKSTEYMRGLRRDILRKSLVPVEKALETVQNSKMQL